MGEDVEKVTLGRALEALGDNSGEEAVREKPTPEIADNMRRVAGRVAEWFKPTKSTAIQRALLARAANKPEVKDAMSDKIQTVEILNRIYTELNGQYELTQRDIEDAVKAAKKTKKKYKEVPKKVLEDLEKSIEALFKVQNMLSYLENMIKKQEEQRSRMTRPRSVSPLPPPPPLRPPVTPPPPTQRETPPHTLVPPGPLPVPRPRQPQAPAQEEEVIPEQPDRDEDIKKLEEALEKALEQHATEHQELDRETQKLRETMREMGDQQGKNSFQKPDEEGFPPPRTQKLSPSMDERKTSPESVKQKPLFTIEPPLQGYYRVAILDSFDMQKIEWIEEHLERPYPSVLKVPAEHRMKGSVRGKIELPLPKGYLIDPESLKAENHIAITYDGRGMVYLESKVPQSFEVYFGKSNHVKPNEPPTAYHKEDIIYGSLSKETEDLLKRVKALKLNPEDKAKLIAEYVQSILEYSNESAYNFIYKTNPAIYFQKIEEYKKADCDVGNGYFVALCRRAGLQSRLVVGHRADGSKNGRVELNTNRHAWAEIWDNVKGEWLSIDATPPGGEQENGGEKLKTNNPEEGVDIKTTPRTDRKNPHAQAKDLKEQLKEAKRKNAKRQLTKDAMKKLGEKEQIMEKSQDEEIERNIKDNINLLETEANRISEEGNENNAAEMKEKAEELKKTLEEFKKDRGNPDKLKGVKEALKNAQELIHIVHQRAMLSLRVKGLLQRMSPLMQQDDNKKD